MDYEPPDLKSTALTITLLRPLVEVEYQPMAYWVIVLRNMGSLNPPSPEQFSLVHRHWCITPDLFISYVNTTRNKNGIKEIKRNIKKDKKKKKKYKSFLKLSDTGS